MNKILIFIIASFLTVGCSRVSNYVATVFSPEKKEEDSVVKIINPICPPNKPSAQIIEGQCDGEWTYDYDSSTQIYTCSYVYKAKITCPRGAVSIGQPSACTGQVDQYTKEPVNDNNQCASLFKQGVAASYRLVCCS